MPLTYYDVVGALSENVLQRMDYWVEHLHVSGSQYKRIADLIENDQILLVAGDNPDHAEYRGDTDTLDMPDADQPASPWVRSMLIHECTHAIADMDRVTITWLSNEAAARIAQAIYVKLSNVQIPAHFKSFMQGAIDLIKDVGLDTSPGSGIRLSQDDIAPLVGKIYKEAPYHKQPPNVADGISQKEVKNLRIRSKEDIDRHDNPIQDDSLVRAAPDILFDLDEPKPGRFDLMSGTDTVLAQAANKIQSANATGRLDKVLINGHTDTQGGYGYNMALSERRAEAVARWLLSRGSISRSIMRVNGFGYTQPIAGTDLAQNRRVEIWIVNK